MDEQSIIIEYREEHNLTMEYWAEGKPLPAVHSTAYVGFT